MSWGNDSVPPYYRFGFPGLRNIFHLPLKLEDEMKYFGPYEPYELIQHRIGQDGRYNGLGFSTRQDVVPNLGFVV